MSKGYGIVPLPDPPANSAPRATPASSVTPKKSADGVACERCGTDMFRMHAVWRCPSCGFKTDCCGW